MKNIYHEGKLINKAGVDRVVLSHVVLKKINWPVFKSALKVSKDIIYDAFNVRNRTHYVTKEFNVFHYMSITDERIGHLTFGANPKQYGCIEFSPSNKRGGINLVNFTRTEFIEFLEDIKIYLDENYGLEVLFLKGKPKQMELNATFALTYPFNDYYRPLSVLFANMPFLKKLHEHSKDAAEEKELGTYEVENNQITVIAYNKSLQMRIVLKQKEGIHIYDDNGELIESDMIRFEFKLKSAKVCKKWIEGLNTVDTLTEDMINNAFERLIKHYFLFPLIRWNVDNKHYLKQKVKKYLKNEKQGYKWRGKLLTELRNEELKYRKVKLLSIEDLNEVIEGFADKSGHKGRRKISKDFSGFSNNDVFLQRDREKLNEIVEDLMCYIHKDVSELRDALNGSTRDRLKALLEKGL